MTFADSLCPMEEIALWSGSYNALAVLGGFNWGEKAEIKTGSIIQLESFAGNPIPIVKDGKIAARAEMLVVDGQFGLQIVEVL